MLSHSKNASVSWKIDCYDTDYWFGSEDSVDLTITNRVLTILLAGLGLGGGLRFLSLQQLWRGNQVRRVHSNAARSA